VGVRHLKVVREGEENYLVIGSSLGRGERDGETHSMTSFNIFHRVGGTSRMRWTRFFSTTKSTFRRALDRPRLPSPREAGARGVSERGRARRERRLSRSDARLSERASLGAAVCASRVSDANMAAIGSKRQRFVGDGNDSMRVTSLVRSLVELPYFTKDGTRVHPSPGSVASSRVAVQADPDASTCVAFVASGGGVWRHAVPFAGGEDVAEGKEAMLKPTTVLDGVTTRVRAVRHRHEIQSIALHDPRTRDPRPNATGSIPTSRDATDVATRLATADASGRCVVTLINASGADDETPRQWFLNPGESSSSSDPPSVAVPGWTGACFDPENPNVVAVARRFAKTVDVFDGDRLIRSMRAPLQPSAVCFVERGPSFRTLVGTGQGASVDGTFTKAAVDADTNANAPSLIALAEGNALSLWDARVAERGGCVSRVSLCNRGQSLFALGAGTSAGAHGGGAVSLPKLKPGDPILATAGAERGVHVVDVDRWSVVKRWPGAMKFDVTTLLVSNASPDHCYLAGLDYELLCGCWARGALAGGFAFRGDSRWLGVAVAYGGENRDVVAGWCESGHLFAARVERTKQKSLDALADPDSKRLRGE